MNDKKIVFSQLMHFISNILPLYFQKIKHFSIKEYAELFRADIILSYENSTRTELARFFVSDETSKLFRETRKAGKKIWACGTTSVRTLESAIDENGELRTGWSSTSCFIKPGYKFKAVDHLITNFHLPKSTLVVLVSAFAGREKTLALYEEAIKNKYRFYSFGDSMLLI